MAQLESAEPRAFIPIPGCKPGLPSTDWTSCSYAVRVVGDTLCIPLDMCAYLRANLAAAGGSSSGNGQHDGTSHAAFSCSAPPADGASLEARDLIRCMMRMPLQCERVLPGLQLQCCLIGGTHTAHVACRTFTRSRRLALAAAHAGFAVTGSELPRTAFSSGALRAARCKLNVCARHAKLLFHCRREAAAARWCTTTWISSMDEFGPNGLMGLGRTTHCESWSFQLPA
jgi:hypothetical protein